MISRVIWLFILYQVTYTEALRYSQNVLAPERNFETFNSHDAYRDATNANGIHPNQSVHLAEVLDSFNASGYDKRIRPHFDENVPEVVEVQIFLTELGPFNDVTMDFQAEMFMRLYWTDDRLKWNASDIWHDAASHEDDILELPDDMFEDFWKPDIFFRNSKEASTHDVTQPNRMFFVKQNGEVTQSERVSVTTHCFYQLKWYPFDNQKCGFDIESYKFTTSQMVLRWKTDGEPMAINETNAYKGEWIEVPGGKETNEPNATYQTTGSFSQLQGRIRILRDINYSFIQTFIPSIFVIIMSLVGFWIDNEDAIERIALAVTTILTLTTQTEGIRNGLPKVSYTKAIDIWMLVCTIFIYGALLQSAYVHYILRCGKKQSKADKAAEEANAPRSMTRNTAITPVATFEEDGAKPKVHYYNLRQNSPEVAQTLARRINMYSKIVFPVVFIVFAVVFFAVFLNRHYQCRYHNICIIPD